MDGQELEDAAGGKVCVCVLGGGGEGDDWSDKVCACVLGGGGEFRGDFAKKNDIKKDRCYCVAAGGGMSGDIFYS